MIMIGYGMLVSVLKRNQQDFDGKSKKKDNWITVFISWRNNK